MYISRLIRKFLQLQNSGMVKRIRGTACSIRVSPAIANRIVESTKGVLLKFLPDVYIHTDHCKGAASGKSPGIYFVAFELLQLAYVRHLRCLQMLQVLV